LPEPFQTCKNARTSISTSTISTHGGRDYRAFITAGGPTAKISDTDINISDADGTQITNALISVANEGPGDLLAVNGPLPAGIVAQGIRPRDRHPHAERYGHACRLMRPPSNRSSSARPHQWAQKRIEVSVFDGQQWSSDTKAFLTVGNVSAPPVLDLDANNSNGGGADFTATFTPAAGRRYRSPTPIR
jgi:hypothetical protein